MAAGPKRADARPTYPEAARTLLRDTLLAAAADLLRESSWSDISMAAVAERAGVSRQTLYNEFRSREEFAQSFAMREADAFLSGVEAVIAAHPGDPIRALGAAFEHFLTTAADRPIVRAILLREPGGDELFALFSTRGGPVLELATERIAGAVRAHWPAVEAGGVRIAAECLVRLAISHASLPTSSTARAAQSIAAVLGPFVAQKIGRGLERSRGAAAARAPDPRRRSRTRR